MHSFAGAGSGRLPFVCQRRRASGDFLHVTLVEYLGVEWASRRLVWPHVWGGLALVRAAGPHTAFVGTPLSCSQPHSRAGMPLACCRDGDTRLSEGNACACRALPLFACLQDEQLSAAVRMYDGKSWKKIAACLPGRSDVQCLHRWQKVLKPGLVKGPWTAEVSTMAIFFFSACRCCA